MSVILLLLIASLSVALLFLGAFIWSVKNRQFDDGFSPPRRILFDEPVPSSAPVVASEPVPLIQTAGRPLPHSEAGAPEQNAKNYQEIK
ncbi:MAG: cbb3-type cytochrome oxidase assembly protein CcoS [Puia sp.]|nr:cbb3-type cytochrome oxidase assembly protein CcoS [Puia sp.]